MGNRIMHHGALASCITGHKSLGSLGHYLEADESEVLAAIVG